MMSPLNQGARPGKSPFCTLALPGVAVLETVTVETEVTVTVLGIPVQVTDWLEAGRRQEQALETRCGPQEAET